MRKDMLSTFKELLPADSLSFPPIPVALQQLTQPPVSIPITKPEPNKINHTQEGYRAHNLLTRLRVLLEKTDEQLNGNQSNPDINGVRLSYLLAHLTKLLATDRLLDSIECSDTCIAQITDPACLQCLLNAHSALSIPLSISDHNISLDKQRQSIALSIRDYFSIEARKALDKIIGISLRSCHKARAQIHATNLSTSDQLVSLLSNLCVENIAPISIYWNNQLFYTALCHETAIICESLSSLALSLSKYIRESMQSGDSRPLTRLLQITKSFIFAYEKTFSISFLTDLITDYGEACLLCFLLNDLKELGPYFSIRLKLVQPKKQPSLVNRLFNRSNQSRIKKYIESIRQNFNSTTMWAPPCPTTGQSLMFDDSIAKHWHITGISQLIIDFIVLFLGSVFNEFTPTDQISTFPLMILHTTSNILAEENVIFSKLFTIYANVISNEAEYNKIDE